MRGLGLTLSSRDQDSDASIEQGMGSEQQGTGPEQLIGRTG